MKTTLPITTISYNTPDFLKFKCDALFNAHKIAFWAFVPHKPEDDEAGNKNHSHLWLEPAVSIQTEDLRVEFLEVDPTNPNPLGCMPFRREAHGLNSWGDFYLYGIHDPVYLASKQESRRFQYSSADFVCSDRDYLHFLIRKIDRTALTPFASMQAAIVSGLSFAEYMNQGLVRMRDVYTAQRCWDLLSQVTPHTDRGGRSNHESDIIDVVNFDPESTNELTFKLKNNGNLNVVDVQTGEVLHSYSKEVKNG